MSTVIWRLNGLGAPCLRPDAAGDAALPLARKDAALLAYVALNGGVSSARVAELLWPHAAGRGALNNLRQRLHRLRKATAARLLEVADAAKLADDLRLEPLPDLAALEASPNAWDGQWLHGVDIDDAPEFATWLAAERKAWAERRRSALAAIASACEKSGELVRALSYAQRLLVDDPLSEHAHRRLMRLHYRRGDTASAVAAFEACERTLKDELGLKPSAETIDLLATVERGTLAAPTGPVPVPASLLRPPRAVGRERERGQLIEAHRDGQIALLVGEAGMGKTRLLQDFAATQPQAVYAQARPGDAAVPYGALARLLRAVVAAMPAALESAPRSELVRVVPEFGEPGSASLQGQTARLQGAIEQLLAAGMGPGGLTLVVDDLHFADRASVEMLRALVDAEALGGLRWAFAHRPIAAADEDGALLQSLADAPRARWIALSALSDVDLTELLASLALPGFDVVSFAPALARHTGGNPLYVLETLREVQAGRRGDLALPRPEAIAHLIDRRLQRLSEKALTLGRVAGLAGPDFSPSLAEAVLGTPAMLLASAWAELEAADVLRGDAFAHDLVRESMLRATPRPIAVHAHGQIAYFLEERGAEPARVAAHWLAAEAHGQAAAGFGRAAERARLAGRPREQAALLQQSADALDLRQDAAAAVATRSQALRPLLYGVGLEAALALSDRLVELTRGGPLAGLVWARRASMLMNAGQGAQAEVAARCALNLLAPAHEALRIEASAALAIACLARGSADEGLELMRPWIDRVEEIDDPLLRIEFWSAHAVLLHHLDRLDEAERALTRQVELIHAAGEEGEMVPALLSLAVLQLRRGFPAKAWQHASQAALAQHVDYGKPGMIAGNTRFLIGMALSAQGRYEEGLAEIDTARKMLELTSPGTLLHSNTEACMAEVLLQIGQAARADRFVAHDHEGLAASGKARRLLARAAIRRVLGQRQDLAFDATVEETARRSGGYWEMLAQVEQARRSEPLAAIESCEAVLARSRRNGDHVVTVLAATVRLDALRTTGPAAATVAAAFELEQVLSGCLSTWLYPPEVHLACFRAHALHGQRDAATRCLANATDWIRRVALRSVPDTYREAFLNRHSVNLALQAEASRWAGTSRQPLAPG